MSIIIVFYYVYYCKILYIGGPRVRLAFAERTTLVKYDVNKMYNGV